MKHTKLITKVIEVRNRAGVALIELVTALKAAFDDGWDIPNNFESNGSCMVLGEGWYRVELIKEDREFAPDLNNVEKTSPSEKSTSFTSGDAVSELEELSKKDELLAFATKYNITIPKDVKYPAAIKSHLEKVIKGSI